MEVRTIVISVNVTTNAPTEDVLQGLREYIESMDEVGAIGETDARVRCEQVMAIVEEELPYGGCIDPRCIRDSHAEGCDRLGK